MRWRWLRWLGSIKAGAAHGRIVKEIEDRRGKAMLIVIRKLILMALALIRRQLVWLQRDHGKAAVHADRTPNAKRLFDMLDKKIIQSRRELVRHAQLHAGKGIFWRVGKLVALRDCIVYESLRTSHEIVDHHNRRMAGNRYEMNPGIEIK